MKRRNFLVSACGVVAGLSGLDKTAFARPCPPVLDGSVGPTNCGSASSILLEAANSLQPGQSTRFTRNTLQHTYDIQWQVQTIWYDAIRRELQYMGKPASSQSQNHSHYVYDENSDTWWTTGKSLFPGFGHIWNATFDPTKGDYWFRRYNDNVLWCYDRSDSEQGKWKQTVAQTSPALNEGNPNFAAMGWHPNLFGTGKPGILMWAVRKFFAYNLESRSFSVLCDNFETGGPYRNRSTGQALYLASTDQLICFAKDDGNGHPAVLVEAGAGNSQDVFADELVSTTTQPPIQIFGGGGDSNHGHVVHHPDDQDKLILLDEKGSSRVWVSSDYGKSWQLKSYGHPFQDMNGVSYGEYTVGTVAPYGIIVGMKSGSDGGDTVLWKPDD